MQIKLLVPTSIPASLSFVSLFFKKKAWDSGCANFTQVALHEYKIGVSTCKATWALHVDSYSMTKPYPNIIYKNILRGIIRANMGDYLSHPSCSLG